MPMTPRRRLANQRCHAKRKERQRTGPPVPSLIHPGSNNDLTTDQEKRNAVLLYGDPQEPETIAQSITAKILALREAKEEEALRTKRVCYRPEVDCEERMTKHTPGPWRVAEETGTCEGMGCFLVMTPQNLRSEGEGIVCGVVDIDRQVWPEMGDAEANARLISAAPDLLAACKALPLDCEFTDASDFKDNSGKFRRAMDLARAAIAKATGDA